MAVFLLLVPFNGSKTSQASADFEIPVGQTAHTSSSTLEQTPIASVNDNASQEEKFISPTNSKNQEANANSNTALDSDEISGSEANQKINPIQTISSPNTPQSNASNSVSPSKLNTVLSTSVGSSIVSQRTTLSNSPNTDENTALLNPVLSEFPSENNIPLSRPVDEIVRPFNPVDKTDVNPDRLEELGNNGAQPVAMNSNNNDAFSFENIPVLDAELVEISEAYPSRVQENIDLTYTEYQKHKFHLGIYTGTNFQLNTS